MSFQSTSGLLTSSYPYLFVEISNESLPSRENRYIYSNNPFATKATFIIYVGCQQSRNDKFVKIGGGVDPDYEIFTFDNLKARITLPNGQVFKTEIDDNLIPNSAISYPNDSFT